MLVSRRHGFIFIHVYKVAGTSIRRALEPYCDDAWKRRLARMPVVGRVYRPRFPEPHLTALQARELLGVDLFGRCFKFAFVRNPWDWQVSLYHFMLKQPAHHQHALARSLASFDDYLRWRVEEDLHLQESFVTDDSGALIVDYVGHMERLDDDFARICPRIGIPPITIPHVNRSRHADYRSYYSDASRDLVAQAFKADIERFGYTFDGLAETGTPTPPGTEG